MSDGLNKEQRYDYFAHMLRNYANSFPLMREDQLLDYAELTYRFLTADNDTSQRACVATMIGISDNASYVFIDVDTSDYNNEDFKKMGYLKAQVDIAKRLIQSDHKTTFVADMTKLPPEEVEEIKLNLHPKMKKIIHNMIKEGMSEDMIAKLMETTIDIVHDVKYKMVKPNK